MASPADNLPHFTKLTESLLSWSSKLDDLLARTASKQSEWAKLTYVAVTRPTKKKGSTETLRDVAVKQDTVCMVNDTTPLDRQSSVSAEAKLLLQQVRRKRKPASVVSGRARHRQRTLMIIYYESVIQHGFEEIVRLISTSRYILNKGRSAADFAARMSCLGSNTFTAAGSVQHPNPDPNSTYLPTGLSGQEKSSVVESPLSAFDTADKYLETALDLCTAAADEFLRYGDCQDELERARDALDQCLEASQVTVERLQAKKVAEEEQTQAVEELDSPPATGINKPESAIDTRALEVAAQSKSLIPVSTGAIEVDVDSDASSVHLDLSALRRTRRV